MDVSALVPAGLQSDVDLCNVPANYNKLSENFRKLTPIGVQCAIFCRGSRCKYENPKAWPPVHMAIRDIFSHWVTDEILAMARPSTAQLKKKNIITQFQTWSIKTIINLQTPGEHKSCGGPMETSGFTYDPAEFMKNRIYYYNFAWKDYDDATTSKLLDMVKVVAFAVQEGRVAIHCHAGLGRTGVLIACYLIYSLRVRANDAIKFVRRKRPGAIQSRGQIQCIQDFELFILPQMTVFPGNNVGHHAGKRQSCTLPIYLKKQWTILHGYDQRTFKYLPKIVFVLCERILELCDCQEDNSPADINFSIYETPFTRKFICHALDQSLLMHENNCSGSRRKSIIDGYVSNDDTCNDLKQMDDVFYCTSPDSVPSMMDCITDDVYLEDNGQEDLYDNDCYKEIQSQLVLKAQAQKEIYNFLSVDETIRALLCDYSTELTGQEKKQLTDYQMELNNRNSTWQRLELETNLRILAGLLFEWLETLKGPVLDIEALSQIVIRGSKPKQCLQKFEIHNRYIIEYLLRFVSRLRPIAIDSQYLILRRLAASLTHQKVRIKQIFMPAEKNFQKLRAGTAAKLMDFFVGFLNFIEQINTTATMTTTRSWSLSSMTSNR